MDIDAGQIWSNWSCFPPVKERTILEVTARMSMIEAIRPVWELQDMIYYWDRPKSHRRVTKGDSMISFQF